MALYLLSQPADAPVVRTRRMLISADSAAKATEVANLQDDGDVWDVAMAEVVSTAVSAPASDYAGWVFEVHVSVPAVAGVAQPDLVGRYAGQALDTLHEVGDGLAAALNALAPIANAAYVRDTRTLTVAGAPDGLGDRKVRVDVFMPGAKSGACVQSNGAFVKSITDGGIAAAALTVVFPGQPSYENWVLNCRIGAIAVSVTGAVGGLKKLMDDLVVALNGTAINAAAYDADTQTLTVAGAADGMGDQQVAFDLYNPLFRGFDRIRDILVSFTDGGAAGDAVTATFKDIALDIPQVIYKLS
jgi:hypothetical protein